MFKHKINYIMKIVIIISAIIVIIVIAIIFKKRNKKNVDNSKGHGLSMYGKDGVKNSHLKDKE